MIMNRANAILIALLIACAPEAREEVGELLRSADLPSIVIGEFVAAQDRPVLFVE